MSYILDALRKADAQRERDPARGIHARPVQLAGATLSGRLNGSRWLLVAGSVVLTAVLLAGGWYVWRVVPARSAPELAANSPAHAPTPAPPVVVSGVVPAAAVQPPPTPPLDPTLAPTATVGPGPRSLLRSQLAQADPGMGQPRTARGAAAAAGGQGGAPAAPSAPPGTAPAPSMPAPTGPAAAPAATPTPAPAMPAPAAPATAAPPTPAPAVPASVTTPPTPGLPADAPKIAITGGVYSASPAQRMLIVNGQVFNEGSEIAAGVTIEEIKSRSVVLRFRGARYTIAY